MTIEDLRNPKRVSGFDRVDKTPDGRARPYRARVGPGGTTWWGTYRDTAEEAAEDYLRWFEGQPSNPATPIRFHVNRGRPDIRKIDGVLHVDLAPRAGVRHVEGGIIARDDPERTFQQIVARALEAELTEADIVEVKLSAAPSVVCRAVGQLLWYRYRSDAEYQVGPDRGRAILALPREPGAEVLAFLRRHDITLRVVELEEAS